MTDLKWWIAGAALFALYLGASFLWDIITARASIGNPTDFEQDRHHD